MDYFFRRPRAFRGHELDSPLYIRDEATIRFENIQDITIDTRGFFATIFDFGDLRVQSAGERREFLIANAAHPEAMKLKIEELQTRAIDGKDKSVLS